MNNKNYILILLGIFVIFILLLSGCTNAKSDNKTIKIGVLLPLSGVASETGEGLLKTMQLAVNDLKNSGHDVELLVEDTQTNPSKVPLAYQKLKLQNPDILISCFSSHSMVLAPLVEKDNIPLIGILTTAQDFTKYKNTIRYQPTAEYEVESIIAWLKQNNIDKVGILYVNDDYGKSVYDTLKNRFDGDVFGETYLLEDVDYKTQIYKLLDYSDVIIMVGFEHNTIEALNELIELNENVTLIGTSAMYNQKVLKIYNSSNSNVKLVINVPKIFVSNNDLFNNVNKKYIEKYNSELMHPHIVGYDSILLAIKLIESKQKDKTWEQVFSNIDSFEGIMGKAIIEGKDIMFPLEIIEIKKD